MTATWSPPLPPPVKAEPTSEDRIASAVVGEWAVDRLLTIAGTSERSQQAALGPSEIGNPCPRRLAYRIAQTPVVNLPDPLKAMLGVGMHEMIAAGMRRLDAGMGRYLVEHPVGYRGIAGRVDAYDRYKATLVDWKTTELSLIKRYRAEGVSGHYRVQTVIYAEGLREQGEDVARIALVFIPRDGRLSDVWAAISEPNRALADEWIDRYQRIAAETAHASPADVTASPGPLCSYCPNYRPKATDLTLACPGKDSP